MGGRYDPLLTCAIPERLRDEQLIVKHYTNKVYITLRFFFVTETLLVIIYGHTVIVHITEPLAMQASIFGACPKPR